MKTLMVVVLAAAGFIGSVTVANAACPKGTRYQCTPTFGGKMQCGCY